MNPNQQASLGLALLTVTDHITDACKIIEHQVNNTIKDKSGILQPVSAETETFLKDLLEKERELLAMAAYFNKQASRITRTIIIMTDNAGDDQN